MWLPTGLRNRLVALIKNKLRTTGLGYCSLSPTCLIATFGKVLRAVTSLISGVPRCGYITECLQEFSTASRSSSASIVKTPLSYGAGSSEMRCLPSEAFFLDSGQLCSPIYRLGLNRQLCESDHMLELPSDIIKLFLLWVPLLGLAYPLTCVLSSWT